MSKTHEKWVVECGMTGMLWGPFDNIVAAEKEAQGLNQPIIRPIHEPHFKNDKS